jgi:uncharacterized membrane protein YcjF (UPF0283 family)
MTCWQRPKWQMTQEEESHTHSTNHKNHTQSTEHHKATESPLRRQETIVKRKRGTYKWEINSAGVFSGSGARKQSVRWSRELLTVMSWFLFHFSRLHCIFICLHVYHSGGVMLRRMRCRSWVVLRCRVVDCTLRALSFLDVDLVWIEHLWSA